MPNPLEPINPRVAEIIKSANESPSLELVNKILSAIEEFTDYHIFIALLTDSAYRGKYEFELEDPKSENIKEDIRQEIAFIFLNIDSKNLEKFFRHEILMHVAKLQQEGQDKGVDERYFEALKMTFNATNATMIFKELNQRLPPKGNNTGQRPVLIEVIMDVVREIIIEPLLNRIRQQVNSQLQK
jgi:hypothetical protein